MGRWRLVANPFLESLFAECMQINHAKRHDYALDADHFSNFKESAAMAGITVEQAFLQLLGTKMSRLKNLLVTDKTPKNEGVRDTLKDLINYAALLAEYLETGKPG